MGLGFVGHTFAEPDGGNVLYRSIFELIRHSQLLLFRSNVRVSVLIVRFLVYARD